MMINKPITTICFLHARKSAQSTLVRLEESVGDGHEDLRQSLRWDVRKPAIDSACRRWGFVESLALGFA